MSEKKPQVRKCNKMIAMTGKLFNSWTYPIVGREMGDACDNGGVALRAETCRAGGALAATLTLGTTNCCPQAGHGICMP